MHVNTQLGVNTQSAIVNGGLANKPSFFGSSIAEIVSSANTLNGSWNGDRSPSNISTNPWLGRSGHSNLGFEIGIFSFNGMSAGGGPQYYTSHRTILLGY